MNNGHLPQIKVQNEITIIDEIFRKIKIKHSCNAIAKDLNGRKIPSPLGGRWTSTAIRRIAENPLYAGVVVIGKTKRDFNPLTETHFDIPIPPEKWSFFEDPILNPYTVISPQEWIKIQVYLTKIKIKSSSKGRPLGEFGPSILSGLLYCGYCGAPLVSGRGKRPRIFRCSHRRLKKGNPRRCSHSFSIREDEFLKILEQIIKNVIETIYHDCIRILNDEFKMAGDDIRKALLKKEDEYRDLVNREQTLIEFYEEAKIRGFTDTFEDYFRQSVVIRKNIISLQQEIKTYRDANTIAIDPIEIDKNLFIEKLNNLELFFEEYSDIQNLRTAIKSFIPKIFIKSTKVEKKYLNLTFWIDEIPAGLPDFLNKEHSCIIQRTKSKNNVRKAIEEIKDFSVDKRNNFFQYLYDNLSDSYVSDKLSYRFKSIIPRYWNVIFPVGPRNITDQFYYSTPFAVQLFGFETDLN